MGKRKGRLDTRGGDDADVSLTRRAMLGTLGAGASIGLAGCLSQDSPIHLNAPFVGITDAESIEGLTLQNYSGRKIRRAIDLPTGESIQIRIMAYTTHYRYENEEWGRRCDVGIVSIPFFKYAGFEYAGELTDPLERLVHGDLGEQLVHEIDFQNKSGEAISDVYFIPDSGASYQNRGWWDPDYARNQSIIFEEEYDSQFFEVAAVPQGRGDDYYMYLLRYRVSPSALSDSTDVFGVDHSYVFVMIGTEVPNPSGFIDGLELLPQLSIIDFPSRLTHTQ